MRVDLTPEGLWNILELILTIVFFLTGFLFYKKYRSKKESELKSTNDFNFGYAFFFWATAINQFVYLADSIHDFIPSFSYFIRNTEFYIYIGSFVLPIKNQILLMLVLLMLSATPVMKSIDKYLRNKPNTPIYKTLLVGVIITSITYIIIFVVGRAMAPEGFDGTELAYSGGTDTPLHAAINYLMAAIALYTVISSLLVIWYFFIFWLILTIKSPKGPFRRKAFLIFTGILSLYIGLFIGNLLKPDLEDVAGGWPILFPPVLFLIGMILLIKGFMAETTD